ncbi:MAG: hypothetical protein CM1200mP3_11380 [Chloroflexota bacterium]|nr:MAG: hypothetical protein CM1200mP3_11380 [Chloroflexota bacterium]
METLLLRSVGPTNRRYTTADGNLVKRQNGLGLVHGIAPLKFVINICREEVKFTLKDALNSRTYAGGDGETRVSLDVSATDVRFIDSRGSGARAGWDF